MFLSPCEEIERQLRTTVLYADNTTAIGHAHRDQGGISNKKSKHFDVKYHWIREQVNLKFLRLMYVKLTENSAEIQTKPLAKGEFNHLRHKLGLR